MDKERFKFLYNLPLGGKLAHTEMRVRQFYDKYDGKVFLSFSGGKDSQVLADIIRNMPKPYCDIELVFFDTNNERKEVWEIVRRYGATVEIGNDKPIFDIFAEVGYPLFNKRISHLIACFQKGQNLSVSATNKDGSTGTDTPRYVWENYQLFINSPLKISDNCCDIIKKDPSAVFTAKTGKQKIVATLAIDSPNRMKSYMKTGCNSFEQGNIKSTPMGFWKKSDVLDYIAQTEMDIAKCYKLEITKKLDTSLNTCKLLGVKQTGCMTCGFGKGREFAAKILKAKCPDYYRENEQAIAEWVAYKNAKHTDTTTIGKIPPHNPWRWVKGKGAIA